MRLQNCPYCQLDRDVSLFVAGQWVRCSGCGERFEVDAPDEAGAAGGEAHGAGVGPSPAEAPAGLPNTPAEPRRVVGHRGRETAAAGVETAAEGREDDSAGGAPDRIPAASPEVAAAQGRLLAGGGVALAIVGLAVLWGLFNAPGAAEEPPPPAGEDGPLSVPLAGRLDAEVSERRFDFENGAAGSWPWYTWRGRWALSGGALVHTPDPSPPARIPRAFLGRERYFAEGFRIEASVSVLPEGPERSGASGDAAPPTPEARLYLYRNRQHFLAFTAEPGPEGGYGVAWALGDGLRYGAFAGGEAAPPPPAPGETVRLALWVEAGVLHAAVDGREIGRARLDGLDADDWGKAGLGCRSARCLVHELVVRGRTRPPPEGDPAPSATLGSVRPE